MSDHQRRPSPAACSRTSTSEWYAAAPRSTGAAPPTAAVAHEASRNSWLVRTRSWARVRMRSGSQARTLVPSGSSSTSSTRSSTSTGASASMPSTGVPSAIRSQISASSGCVAASALARARTSGVSSSSRQGGAHSPCSATSRPRWSATLNQRTSSTVSPQNSTRTGCSSVGGKTSMIPPRTANSPRFSTSSTRAYARSTRRRTTSSGSTSWPCTSRTGSRSPSPRTCGCSSERTGATTTSTGPAPGSSASGCARRRSTAIRRPTVSARGDSRSCGRVSHDGKSATRSPSMTLLNAATSSSASRPVAVTASTGRPVRAARAATTNGRMPAGAVRSSDAVPLSAVSRAPRSAGSPVTTSSSPASDTGNGLQARQRSPSAERPGGPLQPTSGRDGGTRRTRVVRPRDRRIRANPCRTRPGRAKLHSPHRQLGSR